MASLPVSSKSRSVKTFAHARRPTRRTLQVFAFDPSAELDLDRARVNVANLDIRWEDGLLPGPIGEYVEVIDVDPASGRIYPPVDLNEPHLLASRGLAPSEGTPQFHQQMAYAVAMTTIERFEEALGRRVQWSTSHQIGPTGEYETQFRARLRIYPHGLREANAYYSPDKNALLFGYFNAINSDARDGLPGGLVFTCLSHDVIVHEITHAILDGIHPRLMEPTNPDTLAFHEGFSDIVALFQHFTLPGLLEHEIARTRGDLEQESMLADLAVQFGMAVGRRQALRRAIGSKDETTGRWSRLRADPSLIDRTQEPHGRGALFVAAVFDAFLALYRAQVSDLLRLASGGTGILPQGSIHPDLVTRLSEDARKVASRMLQMFIRALDYLPPVDVTYGDYMRALITADVDAVPQDGRGYRAAIINSFQNWGIYPRDVRTISVESLQWSTPTREEQRLFLQIFPPPEVLRVMAFADEYAADNGDYRPASVIDDDEIRRFLAHFRRIDPQKHWRDDEPPVCAPGNLAHLKQVYRRSNCVPQEQ